jgi:hypothetical protein
MGKTDTIVSRILTKEIFNISDLLDGKVDPTDIQSVLLKLYENLAARIDPKNISRQHKENHFVQPCDISQREIIDFDKIIYEVVPKTFLPVELSPVNPLGLNSVLSKISQKNVLSTVRNVEVVADVTTALTLECAKFRNRAVRENLDILKEVNLCTSHRSIRLQRFGKIPGFTPHFRVFGACSSGRDVGHEKFESKNIVRHISIYLDLLKKVIAGNYLAQDICVYISDIRITNILIEHFKMNKNEIRTNTQARDFSLFDRYKTGLPKNIYSIKEIKDSIKERCGLARPFSFLAEIEKKAVNELRKKYPDIKFIFDIERIAGVGYYENLCFKIAAKNKSGEILPLADGGMTDWTKKLLANRKERLLSSGFGSELFCRKFKK